ncbi:hypothetical protein WJX73_008172 [Symbiochloris irregularis]|uniref:MSP domain-containing protein n=1 Tax=Symbiochloris irregularis TaxID=706552 RepID=A0AAW1PDL1_9CHLO
MASLTLSPAELAFADVELGQTYTRRTTLTNNLAASVEVTIRAGSAERYTVRPSSLRLGPGQSSAVEVQLRVLKFAQKQKATTQGHKDIFHIKASFFDQKFYATFQLAPEQPASTEHEEVVSPSSAATGHSLTEGHDLPAEDTEQHSLAFSLAEALEALRDKDELLQLLQEQLQAAKQQQSAQRGVQSKGASPASAAQWGQTVAEAEHALAAAHAVELRQLEAHTALQAKQVAKLQKQLADAQAQAAKLDTSLADARARAAAMEGKCKEVVAARAQLRQKADEAAASFAATETKMTSEVAKLKAEFGKVQAGAQEADQAQRRASTASEQVRKLHAELSTSKAGLRAAQDKNKQLMQDLSDARSTIKGLEAQVQGHAAQSAGAEKLQQQAADTEQALVGMASALDVSLPPGIPLRSLADKVLQGVTRLARLSAQQLQGDRLQQSGAAAHTDTDAPALLTHLSSLQDTLAAELQGKQPAPKTNMASKLHSQLVTAQVEAHRLLSQHDTQEMEMARLRNQLAGAIRKIAAAEDARAEAEAAAHSCKEAAGARSAAANSGHWQEVSAAKRRAEQAEHAADAATIRAEELTHSLRTARSESETAKAQAQAAEVVQRRKAEEALRRAEEAGRAANKCRQEADSAAALAEERRMQLAVVMDALETLQAGTPGERDQAILNLSAQLAAAKAMGMAADGRAQRLLQALSASESAAAAKDFEVSAAVQQAADARASAAAEKAATAAVKLDSERTRQEMQELSHQCTQACREADEARAAADRAEADLQGLQAAVQASRMRHMDQLAAERAAVASVPQDDTHSGPALGVQHQQRLATMSQLVSKLLTLADQATSQDQSASDGQLGQRLHQALDTWKELVVHSDQAVASSQTEAQLLQAELAALKSKCRGLELALDKSQAASSPSNARQDHPTQRQVTALQQALTASQSAQQELAERLEAALTEACGTAEISMEATPSQATADRDKAIQAWFEGQVRPHLVAGDAADPSLALARQVCALQVANTQLVASHAAAARHADAVLLSRAVLQRKLQEAEAHIQTLEEWRSGKGDEESQAAPATLDTAEEVFRLHEQALHAKQHQAELQASLHAAQDASSALEHALKAERSNSHKALEELQARLVASHDTEIKHLRQELKGAEEAHAQLRKQHKQDVKEVQEQLGADLEGRPTAAALAQVKERAQAAEARADEEAAKAAALQENFDSLAEKLASLEGHCATLQADVETKCSALEALESVLGRIELAVTSKRGAELSPSRAGRPGAVASAEEVACVAALSRELVHARLAEANAQRQLRVTARAEIVLRQRLEQREQRIQELRTTSVPATMFGVAKAAPSQVQDLRLDLAKRSADVQFLEEELAQARAAQADHTAALRHARAEHKAALRQAQAEGLREKAAEADQFHRQLVTLQRQVERAHSHASSVLSLPHTTAQQSDEQQQPDISQVMQQLVADVKDKDSALQRALNAVRVAENRLEQSRQQPTLQPLEASQQAVIRDLSTQVAQLSRTTQSLKAERDHLQERLRTLRASLGSARRPGQAPAAPQRMPPPQAQAAPAQTRRGVPTSLEGLCDLLDLHLTTLEQAKQPLHDPQSQAAAEGESVIAPATAKQIEAAISAEIMAMRCTLRVLASTIPALPPGADGNESQEEEGEGAGGQEQKDGRKGGTAALRASLARWKGRCRELRTDMATAAAQAAAQIAALQADAYGSGQGQFPYNGVAEGSPEHMQQMQEAMTKEKEERARVVITLHDSIAAMKRAAQTEAELRREVQSLESKLADAKIDRQYQKSKLDQQKHELSQLHAELRYAKAEMQEQATSTELGQHESNLKHLHSREAKSRLEEQASGIHAQARAEWQGRVSDLESQLEAASTPSPQLLEAMVDIDRLRSANQGLVEQCESQAQQLEKESNMIAQLRHDIIQAATDKASLQTRLDDKASAVQQLTARVAEIEAAAESQCKGLASKHRASLKSLQARMDKEQAALQADAASAAQHASGLQQRVAELEADAAGWSALVAQAQAAAQAAVAAVKAQFEAYRRTKAQEIASLEARLRRTLGLPQAATDMGRKGSRRSPGRENAREGGLTSPADMDAVCKEMEELRDSEETAAARREADFERCQRESLENTISTLQEEVADAKQKLRVSQQEGKAAQDRALGATAAKKDQAAADQLKLQASSEALQAAKEALKTARAESAQRLASVQALQAQLARASAEITVPAAELAVERSAREGAERNLAQARTALMHRGQLIDELRKRVDALADEHQQATHKAAERQAEVVARSRALAEQQAVRENLETRLMHCEARMVELEVAASSSSSQLAELQDTLASQTEQLQQEESERSFALETAREAEGARERLQASIATMQNQQAEAQQQVAALRQQSSNLPPQVSINGHTAEGIASLVDLSPDEISSILQDGAGSSTKAAPTDMVKLIEETCHQVANAMHPAQGENKAATAFQNAAKSDKLAQMLSVLDTEARRAEQTRTGPL